MTPDLSPEAYKLIEEAGKAAAELAATNPAPVDHTNLLASIAEIRAQHVDPTSPIYAGHPERVAQSERAIQVLLARANIVEEPETVMQTAEREHAAAFSMTEMHPNMKEIVASRVAAVEALGEFGIKARREEVRQELGFRQHDELIRLARATLPAGKPLPIAIEADLHALRLVAAQGKYLLARDATKPKVSP